MTQVGLDCLGAWEEVDDTCLAESVQACSVPYGSSDMLCECGVVATAQVPSCLDDTGSADSHGDNCSWYVGRSSLCAHYDDGDFTSTSQCCACGGGDTNANNTSNTAAVRIRAGWDT